MENNAKMMIATDDIMMINEAELVEDEINVTDEFYGSEIGYDAGMDYDGFNDYYEPESSVNGSAIAFWITIPVCAILGIVLGIILGKKSATK